MNLVKFIYEPTKKEEEAIKAIVLIIVTNDLFAQSDCNISCTANFVESKEKVEK